MVLLTAVGLVSGAGMGLFLPSVTTAWRNTNSEELRQQCSQIANPYKVLASALPPAPRTEQQLVDAACEGDVALLAGLSRHSQAHPIKQTGVLGSHVLFKLPYAVSTHMRSSDNMHGPGNEVKELVCEVLLDRSRIWQGARGSTLLKHEQKSNNR